MALVRPQLLSRLRRDLAELYDTPYPGVTVFANDADFRSFCLVLTPPSGPFKDLNLHFDVRLPQNWPTSPPQISSSVSGIEHPNLFGGYICCDLLKEHFYAEAGYTGGYTPALTLRGLFLQFLTFFSGNKVEQDWGGVYEIGDDVIPHFLREDEAKAWYWHKQGECSCRRDLARHELEKLWLADKTEEIVVATFGSAKDPFTQKTKRGMLTLSDPSKRIYKFEQLNPRWVSTYDIISKWSCWKCPYGKSLFHCSRPTPTLLVPTNSLTAKPPTKCLLSTLDDDVLYIIATYLPTESLLSFSAACPRAKAIANATHILLQRELRCFFLRISLTQSVLGVGVAFDETTRSLSSDFDWLSEEAFISFNVRKSIEKRPFKFFLPLAFSRYHFERVQRRIQARLGEIDLFLRFKLGRSYQPVQRQPYEIVGVLYRMMNNIVVSLMRSCDDVLQDQHHAASQQTLLHASEKAVISYCLLFHLLICLCRTTPSILRNATARVWRFVEVPSSRAKATVPDLGEFIVMATLVLALPPVGKVPVSWKTHLNGPLLQEVITRNARWVLRDHPELHVFERGASEYRLTTTFNKSKTSLRLVMFQVTFLNMFVNSYSKDLSLLDDNYGFPDASIPGRMVEEIKAIYGVSFWPGFFDRVQYDRGRAFGKEKFSQLLRDAVRTSAERGYHKPPYGLERLRRTRDEAERRWKLLGKA